MRTNVVGMGDIRGRAECARKPWELAFFVNSVALGQKRENLRSSLGSARVHTPVGVGVFYSGAR